MPDSTQKPYDATISLNGKSYCTPVELEFFKTGEVVPHFPEREYEPDFDFVHRGFYEERSGSTGFSFEATNSKGIKFYTDHLVVNSASTPFRDEKTYTKIKAIFSYLFQELPVDAPAGAQLVRYWMRGFEHFGPYKKQTPIGVVRVRGSTSYETFEEVGGFIEIARSKHDGNLDLSWEIYARKFLDYLHRMMKFARCSNLYVAYCEAIRGNTATKTFYNPAASKRPFIAPIHFMMGKEFFDACIDTYFRSAQSIDRVKYGIDWLIQPQHYNELRLVVRMMALENFVDGLLEKPEKRRIPKPDFRKFRTELERSVDSVAANDQYKTELKMALGFLNSRSLRERVRFLISKYDVPMTGMSTEHIDLAIAARNDVIHRGIYYRSDGSEQERLWVHITVMNELLVRIVFTLIGYQGPYTSWLGGMKHRKFPSFEKHGYQK